MTGDWASILSITEFTNYLKICLRLLHITHFRILFIWLVSPQCFPSLIYSNLSAIITPPFQSKEYCYILLGSLYVSQEPENPLWIFTLRAWSWRLIRLRERGIIDSGSVGTSGVMLSKASLNVGISPHTSRRDRNFLEQSHNRGILSFW